MNDPEVEARFQRWVEHHVVHDEELDPGLLCADRPDLVPGLQELISRYRRVSGALEGRPGAAGRDTTTLPTQLPDFDGFRTIERIGMGGMGEVYKLHDLKLGRIVAAKVLRADRGVTPGLTDFLSEARALALFQDRRIVQIHELREHTVPPVLIMEYVDGFELGRLAPSLEYHQRARIMKEVCEAVHRAHQLGVQHRDLKPSNIMLDAELKPKILDFGLSSSDPARGHFRGTPQYLAPEQLDASLPIDARTDVYALGAVWYEMLTGVPPVDGSSVDAIVANVRAGAIRLPIEIVDRTPEPLQAIALKALETRPSDRYPSAQEMALDLGRYLEGRPIAARPSRYATILTTRVSPHLEQIQDWLRLNLIYPHEARHLEAAYQKLERRDDDWIGESRVLSYSQIALYVGAFLLLCGSLFYFGAHRIYQPVKGITQPFFVLAMPFVGLNMAAHLLSRQGHRAVSVAFYLAGISLLPLFLLIVFYDLGLWVVPPDTPGQLFTDGSVSNRQLQLAIFGACVWSSWLAVRTRTVALSTVSTVLAFLFVLAGLADAGLRVWIDKERWDLLALHLLPLAPIYALLGLGLERTGRPWFGRPLYLGAAVVLIVGLELLALDGRLLHYMGVSMSAFEPAKVSDKTLLATVAGLSANGVLFYLVGSATARHGTSLMKGAAGLLFTIAPFAVLEPLAWLNDTGEYGRVFDWAYLGLALTTALLSHQRQRKSFFYAGLLNTGVALWLIATHYEWLGERAWAMFLVLGGLTGLAIGFGLDRREQQQTRPGAATKAP